MGKKDKSLPKGDLPPQPEDEPMTEAPQAESSKRPKALKPVIPEEDLLEIDVAAPAPLSKAEARAAKKRAKEGKPALDPISPAKSSEKKRKRRLSDAGLESDREDGSPDPGDKAKGKGKGKVAKVKQNSIWIGNLSYRTTPDSLRVWLEKGVEEMGGPGGSVTRVNLPKVKGKSGFSENKGFAYADFISPEAQALAIGLSERVLEGRKVLIKLGDDHGANPDARTPKPIPVIGASSIPKQKHPESATLWMGNLGFDATEEAVRDLIEANAAGVGVGGGQAADGGDEDGVSSEEDGEPDGETPGDKGAPLIGSRGGEKSGLRKVRLGAFEDTGRCKGFAFLDFLTPRHATAALAIRKNHFFGGRKLVLQYASAEATKRSGSASGAHAKGVDGPAAGEGGDAEDGGRKTKYRSPRAERMAKVARAAKAAKVEARGGAPPGSNAPLEEVQEEEAAPKWGKQEGPLPSQKEKKAARTALTPSSRPGADAGPGASKEHGKGRNDQRGKKWEASGRPRPGAALAMAKREKVGIVQSAGQKVVFD